MYFIITPFLGSFLLGWGEVVFHSIFELLYHFERNTNFVFVFFSGLFISHLQALSLWGRTY